MKVVLKRDISSGQWELVVLEGVHNHEPSAAPAAHPAYRIAALDSATTTQVENLALAGLNNSQILAVIRREKPTVILSQKDVSNLVQVTRLRQLDGLTLIVWLLKVYI